jgi:hypothetical protein
MENNKTNQSQTISRENLKEIYDNVCEEWQKTIESYLLWSSRDMIEIPQNIIEDGYNEADDVQKSLIKKYFKLIEDDLFITNFNEICNKLGYKILSKEDFIFCKNPEKQLAVWKIDILQEWFNKDWKPDFSNDEKKYYPYFINEFSSWKFRVVGWSRPCFGSGVAYFKTEKIAEFVGINFMNIFLKII